MRLNVELDDDALAVLDRLQEQTGMTKRQIVIGALIFSDWALEQTGRDQVIVSMHPDHIPYSNMNQFRSDLIRPVVRRSAETA